MSAAPNPYVPMIAEIVERVDGEQLGLAVSKAVSALSCVVQQAIRE